ncbi:Uma2 family endonuclease [Leptolyngbya sp. FACHB-402]|nr:Uma2 family endonuclease [Leptolyngbya sp. FACHB-161]MBD2376214.1 Uma2 family endonuclease [Leptolyngbya sp. FACHB-238]MBD2400489.1 Uma2 family endonuclease [Leptolyngbya sp. FACHB-239]MBD2407031.1 Uma2 family endonuclease [Leptolyngbya sp. FACHB-402]
MYDLPSENPEEPGLPDEFHDLQPQLLSRTLRLSQSVTDQFFTGAELNLYYDSAHPQWYKRPDWFLSIGVPRLYQGRDLRNSYVIWQERRAPFVVVELLSPGTEKEDLGSYADTPEIELEPLQPVREASETPTAKGQKSEKPPSKWKVYEQILRVPYYIVFSRYDDQVHFFKLVGGKYQAQPLDPENSRIWIPELEIGLGLWQGEFEGICRSWLRWYDDQGNWILTDAEQERQRANQAESQLLQVARNLLQTGMSIEQVSQITGLTETEVQQLQTE